MIEFGRKVVGWVLKIKVYTHIDNPRLMLENNEQLVSKTIFKEDLSMSVLQDIYFLINPDFNSPQTQISEWF